MNKIKCPDCNQKFDESELIIFDEFGDLETPRTACKSCFFDVVKKYDLGKCEECGEKLAPVLDDEEDIFNEGLVWYSCSNSHKDEGNHDEIGMHIVQPDDNGEDTWNG